MTSAIFVRSKKSWLVFIGIYVGKSSADIFAFYVALSRGQIRFALSAGEEETLSGSKVTQRMSIAKEKRNAKSSMVREEIQRPPQFYPI